MRREILATLLISVLWIAAGIAVAYSAWYQAVRSMYPDFYREPLPDPFGLGVILFGGAVILTAMIIRTVLPSRETQWRKMMRLLDEAGIEDMDMIQRKLDAVTDAYGKDTVERAALESLLEGKKKNRG